MKKFLLQLALFACVFFVVDKLFYVFIASSPSREVDKRLELLLEGKINKDIVILGSSRAAEDIIASQIEKETKQSAYNLGYPGSNIEFHYFLLKTLLKYNKKPKTIVLTIDNPWELLPDKTLNFRYDRLYPLVKYNYITKELIDRDQKNELAWFLCLGRINQVNFELKDRKQMLKNPLQPDGSSPFLFKRTEKEFHYTIDNEAYSAAKEDKNRVKSFLAFQDACKKNHIQLVLCYAPNFKSFNKSFQNRMQQISLKDNFTFIYDTTNTDYKNIDYFYDESHMNYKGATMFSSEISRFINNLKKA